ncbi:MAG: hypothetical protein KDD19_19150 [Phaeodactylibacter sp.]|nr:hypothetical protein [Phaeodactylibacter sp.]MCB9052057.1 hypothetical protein [Lewinellaceae bacterium]
MKNLIFLLPLFFLQVSWLSAQSPAEYGTPEERASRMTGKMEEGLGLRPNQIDSIHALNLKYARRIQKEVIDTGMNKVSAYFRIRSINKEKEEELFPLLDARQREAYDEMKAKATQELLARFF